MNAAVEVLPTPERAAEAAALRFVAAADRAIRARGAFLVSLSGGHTPRRMYELLATPRFAGQVDWPRVQVCWGDERCVPPDSAESNYRMAWEALLSRVPLPAGNVHRVRGEDDPSVAARHYDGVLHELLDHPPSQLDLVLLGLGGDGHTASLFPGATAVHDSARWVEPAYHEADGRWRVTLTPRLINMADEVVFLVSGRDKATVVERVLAGPLTPHALPAQLIAPVHGTVTWLLDAAAAGESRP